MYENDYRKLTSSPAFIEDLLGNILKESPITYFIVDGVDEVAETEHFLSLELLAESTELPKSKAADQ